MEPPALPAGAATGAHVTPFRDVDEFKAVFERILALMNDHPDVGRKLRDAKAPHRFLFTDLDVELNVTAADVAEECEGRFLRWTWGPVESKPVVTMKMSSGTANRFFQGEENIALAVALGRVRISGPVATLLALAPVTKPIHGAYRRWLGERGLRHLLA